MEGASVPGAPARSRGLVALSFALVWRGIMTRIAAGLALAIAFAMVVVCFVLSRSGKPETLVDAPVMASSALAWGAGVLIAFGAATRSFQRDRDDGVYALARARGSSDMAYLWARVLGIARVLVFVVAGGTLLVGLVAVLLSNGGMLALKAAQATLAATIFSLAFAATLAPIAMVTLAARARFGGYVALVLVLVVPEVFSRWTAEVMPDGFRGLTSIPGALLSLRSALIPTQVDGAMALRAAALLALIVAIALLLVRVQLARFEYAPSSAQRAVRS